MPDPRQPSEPTSPSEVLDAGIPVDAADIDDVPAADDAEPPGPRSEHAEAAPAPGGIRGALRRSWAGVRRVFAPLGRIPQVLKQFRVFTRPLPLAPRPFQ